MTSLRLVRWPFIIVVLALAAWYPLFNYLVDFRPPDVPFVTTPPDIVNAMLELAEVKPGDVVYDLGSGDGRILFAAAERGATAVGIELDPDLVEQSRATAQSRGFTDRVTIRRGDIFKADLTPATVVMMYLKPDVNVRLRPQLDQLKPGSRIVSHWFSMKGAKPAKMIEVKSAETGFEHKLTLWVTPLEWE